MIVSYLRQCTEYSGGGGRGRGRVVTAVLVVVVIQVAAISEIVLLLAISTMTYMSRSIPCIVSHLVDWVVAKSISYASILELNLYGFKRVAAYSVNL